MRTQVVALATSFCIPRHEHIDYGYKGWLPGDWLPLRANRIRRWHLKHVTFKTFAWLASHKVYTAMQHDVGSMLSMPAGEKRLHESMHGCSYCTNFCYDHYLEWRWRDAALVCPEVPRARQLLLEGGGGMTEKPGATASDPHAMERAGILLNDKHVNRWEYVDGSRLQRCRRAANGLGIWLVSVLVVWAAARHCHLNATCKLFGVIISRIGKMSTDRGITKMTHLTA